MPASDLKITALTALTAADPANDVLPIVDVSDNSMAASGTTKKISINNILACSPTATLASATITGDLTARNWFVTGGSLPGVGNGNPFAYRIGGGGLGIGAATETGTTAPIVFYAGQGGVEQYRIAPLGVNTWSDGAGGTRMTLNSTGLGLGVSPLTALSFPIGTNKVVGQSATSSHAAGNVGSLKFGIADGGGDYSGIQIFNTHNGTYSSQDIRFFTGEGGVSVCTERMRITPSGNVGIGVTPITSHILSSAGPIGISGTNSGTRTSYISNSGACSIYYTDGGGSGFFADFGNLIIQPRTSAARSVVIATGSTTPVERAVVKSTGQVRFVPLASDPAGAEAGDVYYNSTSNKLKCYNGTTWNDLF